VLITGENLHTFLGGIYCKFGDISVEAKIRNIANLIECEVPQGTAGEVTLAVSVDN
jgi:hypothetical protein